MTELDARGAATGTGDRSRPRAVLPALCITQITSWGIVYYAFPVLNPAITTDTGWPTGATTAAFSVALLISAFAGIRVGRIIDRRGPCTVMTTGSVLGVASLLIVATAPNLPMFFSGWLLAGFAMAATFYQPAFAALTRWWAPDHVRALTVVTLAGGLASTVFAPLTAALADLMSWRMTYAVLALVLALVTVPAHALALKAPWPKAPPAPAHASDSATVARSRPFWMLAIALTLSAFAVYAVVIALVPLFLQRGYSTSQAAWALGLGGADRPSDAPSTRRSPVAPSDSAHHHTHRFRRHHHRRARTGPRPVHTPDRPLGRSGNGPRQPHLAASHRRCRPMGHHALRAALGTSGRTSHHRLSPRPLCWRRPGRPAGRIFPPLPHTRIHFGSCLPHRTASDVPMMGSELPAHGVSAPPEPSGQSTVFSEQAHGLITRDRLSLIFKVVGLGVR